MASCNDTSPLPSIDVTLRRSFDAIVMRAISTSLSGGLAQFGLQGRLDDIARDFAFAALFKHAFDVGLAFCALD